MDFRFFLPGALIR